MAKTTFNTSLFILNFCFICTFPINSYSQAGELDLGFGIDGIVKTDFGTTNDDKSYAVLVQPDGKIITAGYTFTTFSNDFAVARYNYDGSLDVDFGTDGLVTIDFNGEKDFGYAAQLQPDGKILVAGTKCCFDDFGMIRLNTDGTLDNTFGGDGKVETDFFGNLDNGLSIAIQTDGKIVMGGEAYGADRMFGLIRFNADGTIDDSFGVDGKVTTDVGIGHDYLKSITLQADGKILAGGYYDTEGSDYHDYAIVRYNTDGTIDNSFGVDGFVKQDIYHDQDFGFSIKTDADDNVLLAGYSDTVDGKYFTILRYTSAGLLDNTFGENGITTINFGDISYCKDIVLQPDGKIILAGFKVITDPDYEIALTRLNTDGKIDTSFGENGLVITDVGPEADYVYAVALQPDSKILAAGYIYNAGYDFLMLRYTGDKKVAIHNNLPNEQIIAVNPNPFNDQFAITKYNSNSNKGELVMYNLSGQTLLKEIINNSETLIDAGKYPSGIYFLKYTGIKIRIKLIVYMYKSVANR